MKKTIVALLVGLLVLAGCAGKGPQAPKTEKREEKNYSIGTSIINEYTANEGKDGTVPFESNVTYTTVALEGDKIAFVTIDAAQNKYNVVDGVSQEFTAVGTKKERGNDYGLNWFEQVAEFEEYAIGKTVQELLDGDSAADLSGSVSISVDIFVAGVKAAADNAVAVENVANIANASVTSTQAEAGTDKLEIVTTVAAVGTNSNGEVVYSFVDESQAKADIVDGQVMIDQDSVLTKGEKKEAYGMSSAGLTEWYLQAQHLTDWTKGKNADAIGKGMEDADLTSTVTIYPGQLLEAYGKALQIAR